MPSSYEGGWDCVRDEKHSGIICKLSENNPANMLLIAAAPDLLKELKRLHRAYCFAVGCEGRQHEVAIDALEAIAKAEGNP